MQSVAGICRPPGKHGSGSDVSNESCKGVLDFNKDFPCINAKAVCIKCSDGWMPRYWHWCTRMHIPGMPGYFDPLADKIMYVWHCCSKYPLSLYYFPECKLALHDRG